MLKTSTRRVGVFIDVQNMYYSARNIFNRKVNFENIVKHAIGDKHLIRAIAYTISTKGGDESAFFEALRQKGIEVKSKELLEFNTGAKKGDWDVGITVDIIRMLDMLDEVVLVSGDGDFVPLADFVRSRGRTFSVISFRESTSTSLVHATDTYTNMSENRRKFLIPDKNAPRTTPTRKTTTSKPTTTRTTTKPTTRTAKTTKTATKTTTSKSKPPSGRITPITTEDLGEDEIEESRTRRLSF